MTGDVKNYYSVDRITDGIATLISDDGAQLTLPCCDYEISVNDVVEIEFKEDAAPVLIKCEEERERRFKKNQSRLHSLFAKGKKK